MAINNKLLEQFYKKSNDLQFKYNASDDMTSIILSYSISKKYRKDENDENFDLQSTNVKYDTNNNILTDFKDLKNIIAYSTRINSPIFSYPIIMNMRKGENTTMNNTQIISYFKNILKNYDTKLDMNNKILSNMPIIKGTRIPVSLIVACLRDEMSIKEIEENYNIDGEEIEKAMDFVIEILDFPFQNEE